MKPCKTTASGPSARGVTLQMLLADRIIRPEKDSMSLEYMVIQMKEQGYFQRNIPILTH